MYGLTKKDKQDVFNKIEKQKDFLYSHYIEVAGERTPLANFFKNTFINPDRYIAELQHRVWSLVEYAKEKELVNIFFTLTLPSSYHPTKTLKNGRIVKNPKFANGDIILYDIITKKLATSYTKMIFRYYKTKNRIAFTGRTEEISLHPKDYTPVKGSKHLTQMFEKIRKDRSYQDLDKDEKVYFRVTEPHKSGTPHLHISLWIPKASVKKIVKAIHRFYPAPRADISTSYIPSEYKLFKNIYKDKNHIWCDGYKLHEKDKSYIRLHIEDSVAYLMKYIYKTLDDLREDKGITEITMWYILHGICRFYTSRTLISLNIYRPLGGKLSLLELTEFYQEDSIHVYLDTETNQPMIIQYNDTILWNKKKYDLQEFDKKDNEDTRGNIRTIPVEIDGIEFEMLRVGSKLKELDPYENQFNSDTSITPVTKMKSLQLYNYFNALDIEDLEVSLVHYLHVENEMKRREMIEGSIVSLNNVNTSFMDSTDLEYYQGAF